ncbi:sensor histidine kinase [Cohnella yongneupensis]|uniref:histidine kinase n=1 Tax=Cohnella yongneupensis TaxID=425006 RepID=A0ABW0QWB5_9BACL
MFNSTRRRLALLNAAVFLLVLAVLSYLLYAHMRNRLLHETDESMKQANTRLQSAHHYSDMLQNEGSDSEPREKLTYLMWDAKGKLVSQSPPSSFEKQTAERFGGSPGKVGIRTVSAGGNHYRVMTVSLSFSNPEGIVSVGIVKSLGDVDRTLQLLLTDIIAALVAGGIFSIVAGMFLSGRALIPIRRSWDKQQRFVTDASHELRTPAAVIHAQTELILQHPEHSVEHESPRIAVILKESRRLGKLVDDLLTLARSDSNQAQIHPSRLSLDSVLLEVTESFRLLAASKGIAIVTEIERPLALWGDDGRIRQLLVIVLDNALKYTPEAGEIRVAGRYASSYTLSIVISDTGCGIAEEDLPHVFERFYRGDKSRSRTQGGTGLGLSIARWIVEAHGGSIRIHSKGTEGTQVELLFPRKAREIASRESGSRRSMT